MMGSGTYSGTYGSSACVSDCVFALWLISALRLVLVVNSLWTHARTKRHMLAVLTDLLI